MLEGSRFLPEIAFCPAILSGQQHKPMPIEREAVAVRGSLDADFNPDPARAVWIEGELNQELLDRVQPEILALTTESDEPITVFINSCGGNTSVRHQILALLSSCRIITVARQKAESAAADLLSAGDWAIAQPDSLLLYHGGRIPNYQPLTAEWATLVSGVLKDSNGKTIENLARKCIRRFRFVLSALRSSFEDHRREVGDPVLPDLECLHAILGEKLSGKGQELLRRTFIFWNKFSGLVPALGREIERAIPQSAMDFEKAVLKACMEFEWQTSAFDATKSLSSIGEGFTYLRTCFPQDDWSRGGQFWDWGLFVALCCALQEGENELTPTDALWLGLIDTIRTDIMR